MISRAEALAVLAQGYRTVEALVARLDETALVKPATIGGGDWSAKDLIGHLAFWEELALDALADLRRGAKPQAESTFVRGAEAVDELNAQNQAVTAAQSLGEVRVRAAAAHAKLTGEIEHMADGEWTAKVPYETERRARIGEMLASICGAPKRGFGHAFAHIPDLEAYVTSVLG